MPTILKTIISFLSKKEVYGVIVTIAISYFLYRTATIVLNEIINYGKNHYERKKRIAGKSKYSPAKMTALALDGITSLSVKPIRIITLFGCLVALLSFLGILWSVIVQLTGNSVAGWASITSILCFLGGVQLISLGIIGEYIGKIYLETKGRPRYIIEEKTDSD